MTHKLEHPDLPFYLGWVALSTLAILLAFGGTFVMLGIAVDWIGDWIIVGGERHITEDYLFSFVFPPLIWLFTSGLQYALLRRYLSKMGWWFLATGAGWLIAIALLYLISQTATQFFAITPFNALTLSIIGASIGLMQWLLLRRLPNAIWWIVASALGWSLINLIGLPFTGTFDILVIGLFPGLTTAVCWGYLFNQQPKNTETQNAIPEISEEKM
jgi:hypothetical protein